MRDDEVFGFTVIDEPTDPDDVQLLPVATDRRTPKRRWESGIVTKWSSLGRFFDVAAFLRLPSDQPNVLI